MYNSAFPFICHDEYGNEILQEGMTLRDYFAGQAMIAILSGNGKSGNLWNELSEQSYKFADAMLKERERK